MVEFLTDLQYPVNPDPPRLFLYYAQMLETSIVRLRSGTSGAASSHRAAVQEAVQYTSQLLAHIVAANANVSYPEIDLLRRYHSDSYSLTEEVSSVFDQVRATPMFVESVPSFLADADTVSRELSREMLTWIDGMCTAIATVDRVVEPSESKRRPPRFVDRS